MLFFCGTVAPIDPRTKAVIGPLWFGDGNRFGANRTYTLAQFPIQGGYGVTTDAILRGPPVLSGIFKVNPTRGEWSPIPTFPGRAEKLIADFEAIEGRLGPVRMWLNGFPAFVNYGISAVDVQKVAGTKSWQISCTFNKLAYTTLQVVPPGVDPDLLQLGVVPL